MADKDLEFENSETPVDGATASTIELPAEKEEQYQRIVRNLQEATSTDIIRKVLSDGKTVKCYWGTATTGRPHIAYCVPLLKIADFLSAGVHVKILLADLHAFLDANKSKFETLKSRVKYYSYLLKAMFTVLGVPVDKLEFVTGTSYQLSAEYTMDMYKFHALTSTKAAEHAGADVVKASESPLMCSLLYPGLQALDEQYLDVDFQFGGVDQRKIFMYAAHFLPKLGYAKRAHLMNPMVPGLSGGKMSSSDPRSKIDFLDSPADVKNKLKAAVCSPGVVENNGVLAFAKAVLFPVQALWNEQARAEGKADFRGDARSFIGEGAPEGTMFTIPRPEKFGGDIHVQDYEDLEKKYEKEEIHPGDLKAGVTEAMIKLLKPIQELFAQNEDWQAAEKAGYREEKPVEAVKKDVKPKKEKNLRSAPPTEEERAALRAQKEAEKAAKQAAKDAGAGAGGVTAAEVKKADAEAAAVSPVASSASSSSVALNEITQTDMPDLKLLARGKVRDLYELPDAADADKLLFVATDRISAFDVIMENGIPRKGITLSTLSLFWFHKLSHVIPNHILTPALPPSSSPGVPRALTEPASAWHEFPRSLDKYRPQLEGRAMIVRKCEVVKVEAIVRGYITGSAWNEYKVKGTVHGIEMPKGLVESEKLERPLFTPSTKADLGDHDENIHPDKVKDICGPQIAKQIEDAALRIYTEGAAYALERGLILADTKFEFGLLDSPNGTKQLVLIDELLTPDSSRYWSADVYEKGKPQPSFDKQYLRDWLISNKLKAVDGVSLPEDVVKGTREKYEEARERVMGLGRFA